MNFVTELIKYQPYKELLINHFPKPIVQSQVKKVVSNNHPSVTGCAFEIFFKLLNTSCIDVEAAFKTELGFASEHIKRLKALISYPKILVSPTVNTLKSLDWESHIYLSKRSYDLIKENFIEQLDMKLYTVNENSPRTIRINQLFTSDMFEHVQLILHTYPINEFEEYVLIDIESIALFLEEKFEQFKKRASLFANFKEVFYTISRDITILRSN